MGPLFSFLDKYFFTEISGGIAYEIIKAAWDKSQERSWETLYLDSFEQALNDMLPALEHYTQDKSGIGIDRETLYRALHQDLVIAPEAMTVSNMSDSEFAAQLGEVLVERSALIIPGHPFSNDDYAHLVFNLIKHAKAQFKASVLKNEPAFRKALLDEIQLMQGKLDDVQATTHELQAYLHKHFDLLPQVASNVDVIKKDVSEILEVARVTEKGVSAIGKLLEKPQQNEIPANANPQDEASRWRKAKRRYLARMKEIYGYTRLLGNPKRIEIEDIYTDVYVLDKPSAIRRYDLDELQKKPFEREQLSLDRKRQPIMDLVGSEKRLFILGKPGAGKTTFLKYLTLQACVGKVKKTPVFISLKEWTDSGQELMPFIVQTFDDCEFPNASEFIEHSLRDGAALVLFDGLDEVRIENEQGEKIIQTLARFAKRYLKTQMCITCRVAAVDYMFTEFSYLEVADFDEQQQNLFARKWYQDEPEKLQHFLVEFGKAEHEGLRELARTPLLLAIFCLVFDETSYFPTRRTDLYREALDVLLKKWDSTRGIKRDSVYRKLSPRQKEQMLSFIAAQNFEAGIYFIHQETLVGQIVQYLQVLLSIDLSTALDGEVVLKDIETQHGLLVEQAHGIYSFSHLTFQEYFTALYIVANHAEKVLIKKHLQDNQWREVFLLIANMLDSADDFFEMFLEELVWWLAENEWLSELFQWIRIEARKYYFPKVAVRKLLLCYGIGLSLLESIAVRKFSKSRILAYALALAYNKTSYNAALALSFAQADTLHVQRRNRRACNFARSIALDLDLDLDSELDLILTFIDKVDCEDRDIQHLTNYLKARNLLLDCLSLASVIDRERIELAVWSGGVA